MGTVLQDQAVDSRLQLPKQIGLAVEFDRLQGGQQRHLDRGAVQFLPGEGWKSGVPRCGRQRVAAQVFDQRPMRQNRTDTPAQLGAGAQGDEAGAESAQPGLGRDLLGGRIEQLGQGLPGNLEKSLSSAVSRQSTLLLGLDRRR